MNYLEAINFIESFPDTERFGMPNNRLPMSLVSMRKLLERLHYPQKKAHTIHITGSKGKGSTATLINGMLQATGFRTALFTSPHLHSYRERIMIDGKPISERQFTLALEEIKGIFIIQQNDEIAISDLTSAGTASTFGILVCLFFQVVAQSYLSGEIPIDWQIVEVGLGGTHDATNVFDRKDLAVITPISLEHTALLGKTPAAIAVNKAGIITPGCTTILAPQRYPEVNEIIRRICVQQGSTLVDVAQTYPYEILESMLTGQTFALKQKTKEGYEKRIYRLNALGEHQVQNAVTALACMDVIRHRVWHLKHFTNEQIGASLAQATLPGRFEIYSPKDLSRRSMPTIILDGAHNGDSARALANTIRQNFPGKKIAFILGANQDKDLRAIWSELVGLAAVLITTCSQNKRSFAPVTIAEQARSFQGNKAKEIPIIATRNASEALQHALTQAKSDDIICATGSLYLVAELRERLLTSEAAFQLSETSFVTAP